MRYTDNRFSTVAGGAVVGQHAFTLLELMIAVSLGAAVALILAATFRAASQAFQSVERTVAGNTLLAQGVSSAFKELDAWNFYDDRNTAPTALTAPVTSVRNGLRATHKTSGPNENLLWVQDGNAMAPGTTPPYAWPAYLSGAPGKPPTIMGAMTGTSYTFGLPFSPFQASWGPSNPMGQNFGGPVRYNPQCGWLSERDYEDMAWALSGVNTLTWWTARWISNLGLKKSVSTISIGGDSGIFPGVMRRGYAGVAGVSGSPSPTDGKVRTQLGYSVNVMKIDELGTPAPSYCGPSQLSFLVDQEPYNSAVVGGFTERCSGWLFNQIRGLQTALGFYGMLDYLPVGVIPAYLVAEVPKADGNPKNTSTQSTLAMDTNDWDGFPLYLTYGFLNPGMRRNGGQYQYLFGNAKFFNFRTMANINTTNRLDLCTQIPTRNNLLYPGGYSIIPWCNEWDQNGIWNSINGGSAFPLFSLGTAADLAFYHRSVFAFGEQWSRTDDANQDQYFSTRLEYHPDGSIHSDRYITYSSWARIGGVLQYYHMGELDPNLVQRYQLRTTGVMRLTSIAPQEWPVVKVAVSHHLRSDRFFNNAAVSWTDNESGKHFELRFSGIGTTLRGARRQRNLDR